MTGTIKRLRIDKGYGFIRPDGGGVDLFFHVRSLHELEWTEALQEQRVQFDVTRGPDGRMRAEFVRPTTR